MTERDFFQTSNFAPSDKLIYLTLRGAVEDDGAIRKTVRQLSYETGLAERTIRSAIKRLQDAKLITVSRRESEKGRPHEYTVLEEIVSH